jgi:hypothetical protein
LNNYFEQITWQPALGDPTVIGWLICLSYFFACLISLQVYLTGEHVFDKKVLHQKRLWLAIAVSMLLLGLNKQLDLQTLFTEVLRIVFLDLELYENRRIYQKSFIFTILLCSGAIAAWLIYVYRNVVTKNLLAITGICFLMAYIIMRASSFHHMDYLTNISVFGVKFNWLVEVTGIFLIISNGVKITRKRK